MSKVIDRLTPAQEAMLPQYVDRFLKIGLSTRVTDKSKAEDAIRRKYAYLAKTNTDWVKPPSFTWVSDPIEGAKAAAQYHKGFDTSKGENSYTDVKLSDAEIQEQADRACYGSFESYLISTYAFAVEQLGIDNNGSLDILLDIINECGPYWVFEGRVVICPKPAVLAVKDGNLHSEEGMAMSWENGVGFYMYNGEVKDSLMDVVMAARMTEKPDENQAAK